MCATSSTRGASRSSAPRRRPSPPSSPPNRTNGRRSCAPTTSAPTELAERIALQHLVARPRRRELRSHEYEISDGPVDGRQARQFARIASLADQGDVGGELPFFGPESFALELLFDVLDKRLQKFWNF